MLTSANGGKQTVGEAQLRISTWKYAKDWVYSITYDEALSELARHAIPLHDELGIPGHVEVVGGHIGAVRAIDESSFNGMRHMDAAELCSLLYRGWGVGCHSWSHGRVQDDFELELLAARKAIEDAIQSAVTLFVAPGNNDNLTQDVRDRLPRYGYLAGLGITDDINRPNVTDLTFLNRVPIHERYWGPFDSGFDPYKRLRQAQEEAGWIVDYCHCPLENAIHDYKDCTAVHHRQRFEAVLEAGGTRCWYANPDRVVDYIHTRRHARIETGGAEGTYIVRLDSLPERVQCRELTFEIETVHTPETLTVTVGGVPVAAAPKCAGVLQFTAKVDSGTEIVIRPRVRERSSQCGSPE